MEKSNDHLRGEPNSGEGARPVLPQLLLHPDATWSHLHAIRLVAHGHRLAPHVTHGAGLRGLGDGRKALRGLGGHVLWREGCDGRRSRALAGEGSCPARLPDSPASEWAGRTSRRGWRWARWGPGGLPGRRPPLPGTCRRSPWQDLRRERSQLTTLWGQFSSVVTSGTKFTFHILTKVKEGKSRMGEEL